MKTSSLILIPSTQFNVANENYDPATDASTFSGIPQKAAAYYSKDKSIQTLSWYMNTFIGVLTIEATLDGSSDTDNYFPIGETVIDGTGGTPVDGNAFENIEGNYTWIRATVTQWTSGAIGKVVVGY